MNGSSSDGRSRYRPHCEPPTATSTDRRKAYARHEFSDLPERLELPAKAPRPQTPLYVPKRAVVRLPAGLAGGIEALAHRLAVPVIVPLLAGWAALLSRWSGQDDLVIGVRIPSRSPADREPPHTGGPVTVGVRCRLREDPAVKVFLKEVKSGLRKAASHQEAGFDQMAADLRRSGEAIPGLQAAIALNATMEDQPGPSDSGRTSLELVLSLEETSEGFIGTLDYASELFTPATVERLLAGWEVLLGAMIENVYQPVGSLPVMTEAETGVVLRELNATGADYQRERLIHELFEDQVERTPEAVAVMHAGRQLSYGQLNRRANQLARYLVSQGVGPDQVVGICMERGLELAVAVLAILKSGGAYLPLDPGYPTERLRQMLEDAAPQIVLTETELLGVLPASGSKAIALDAELGQIAGFVGDNLPAADLCLSSNSLLYVIYTSGSTGRPKGTAMPHRSMVNLMEWHRKRFGSSAGQRVLQFAALSFDVAFQEMFSTLCTGGTLVLLDEWVRRDIRALAEFLESQAIHRLFLPPLMLQSLAEHVVSAGELPQLIVPPPSLDSMAALCSAASRRRLPTLKDVITAGEQLRVTPEIRALFRQIPDARLHNHYGPTETHVVMALTLDGDPSTWPDLPSIGRPIANTQIYVLDSRMQPVPIGVAGEVHIGGANLARGYLNRPQLTGQRFVADPFSSDPGARLYKTGDLGRWGADGTLEYLGRNDDQVKVRGFRIELGEIEAQLMRHGQVGEAVVVACEGLPGQRRLVAYVTPRGESCPAPEALRAHLEGVLPDYMVPSAFVVIERLPLTPSGKLDRRSLPLPDQSAYASRDYEPPRGEVESLLAQVWQDLLGVERVGRNDSFFALGGHSYLMVQMMERLRRSGLSAEVRRYFESATLADLARALTRDAPEQQIPPNRIPPGCSAITPDMLPLVALEPGHIERIVGSVPGGAGNVQDIYPLAPLQEGILFHHLLDERKADTYVVPTLLEVASRDRLEDLIAALQTVIDRHDVLRTGIHWEGLPRPVQVVQREAALPVEEIAFDTARDPLEQMRERMVPGRLRLDVGRAPMLRLEVAGAGRDGAHYALLQIHHLVCDHESLEALLAEVMACMEGRKRELPAAEPYRNHVAQALGQAGGQDWDAFFRGKLGDVEEPTAPFDLRDVRGDGSRTGQAEQAIPPDLAGRIRAQARRLKVSAAVLFHAAWALAIACTSGRDNVVFGTVLLGRLEGSAGAQPSLGMFMNTLPLRLPLEGLSVKDLIERTQRELVELVAHEQAPLAAVQRTSGMEGSAPLFTALLNYRHSAPTGESQGVADDRRSKQRGARVIEIREWTNYPVALSVDDWGEGFTLMMQTDERIDPQRMIGYMRTALAGIVEALEEAPERNALAIRVLPESERREVLEKFNATEAAYAEDTLIHELVEEQAARRPDAIAVMQGNQALSYRQLNSRANQLAWYLRDRGLGPEQLVAVYMERSLEMVIALLGILKSGAAYVPLDPTYPRDRITRTLQDAAPRFVLTQARLNTGLPQANPEPIVVDADWKAVARYPSDDPDGRASGLSPNCLAYVIYTSGSTGTPKGVLIEHGGVINLIKWHCTAFDVGPGTRSSSLAAVGFDATVWEIWPTLGSGATLVLAPASVADDPDGLLSWWAGERLHVSFLPTPVAELAFNRGIAPPGLRILCVGGDRLRHRARGQRYSVINNYGPTETTVCATSGQINDSDEVLHIGKPIANSRIYILNRRLQPVPIGVAGEIYIAGAGIARGYLNRPETTAERFLADPFSIVSGARMYKTGDLARWRADGSIEYLGRNDQQVKIRGFRIELGEIEAQLSRFPQVKEAVVMVRDDAPGGPGLVAYFVPECSVERAPATDALREQLRVSLPEYMVPRAFVALERLPLTPNGKLDRRALPAPDISAYSSRRYSPPCGAVEERVAQIWRDLLRNERIGRADDFFELGGHSLTATQTVVRIRAQFSVHLTVGSLFEHPTLAELAEHVVRLQRERSSKQTPEAELNAQEIAGRPADPDQAAPQRALGTIMTGARQ